MKTEFIILLLTLTVLALAVHVNGRWDMNHEFVKQPLKNDSRTFDQLIQDLNRTPDRIARKNAALVLGCLNDTKAVEPLIQLTKDENSFVRARAVDALGYLKATKTMGLLIQALKDDDWMVRGAAMSVQGRHPTALAKIAVRILRT